MLFENVGISRGGAKIKKQKQFGNLAKTMEGTKENNCLSHKAGRYNKTKKSFSALGSLAAQDVPSVVLAPMCLLCLRVFGACW